MLILFYVVNFTYISDYDSIVSVSVFTYDYEYSSITDVNPFADLVYVYYFISVAASDTYPDFTFIADYTYFTDISTVADVTTVFYFVTSIGDDDFNADASIYDVAALEYNVSFL